MVCLVLLQSYLKISLIFKINKKFTQSGGVLHRERVVGDKNTQNPQKKNSLLSDHLGKRLLVLTKTMLLQHLAVVIWTKDDRGRGSTEPKSSWT